MTRPVEEEEELGEEAYDEDVELAVAGDGDEQDEFEWADPSAESGGLLGKLFKATEAGDVEEVRSLAPACRSWLESAARGPDGDTALHLAALYGHTDCFFALLEAGADPRAVDQDKSTVLHDAAAGGSLAAVLRLLELAPELVSARDEDEETPLHCAARGGFAAAVSALLAAGAPRDVLNVAGQTAAACVDEADADTARLLA